MRYDFSNLYVRSPHDNTGGVHGHGPPKKIQERWICSSPMSFKSAHPHRKIWFFFFHVVRIRLAFSIRAYPPLINPGVPPPMQKSNRKLGSFRALRTAFRTRCACVPSGSTPQLAKPGKECCNGVSCTEYSPSAPKCKNPNAS